MVCLQYCCLTKQDMNLSFHDETWKWAETVFVDYMEIYQFQSNTYRLLIIVFIPTPITYTQGVGLVIKA